MEGTNTIDEIATIINMVDPDILAINEACDWDLAAVQKEIIEKTGMDDYFISSNYWDGSPQVTDALFVNKKRGFTIIETDDISLKYGEEVDYIISHSTFFSGLRAKVKTPSGQIINIIVTHLCAYCSEEESNEQTEWILNIMKPYDGQLSIITGDMNDPIGSPTVRTLRADNWKMTSPIYSTCPPWPDWVCQIDQIWIKPYPRMQFHRSPEAEEMRNNLRFYNSAVLDYASDHRPQADVIAIYPP